MLKHFFANNKADQLIAIGQISAYFGLFVLTLRHVFVYPANHFEGLAAVLLVGFLPSLLYKALHERFFPYLLVGNALLLVSVVFVALREWALAGVFVLVPVFSLLFQDRKIYLISAVCSLALNFSLCLLFLFDAEQVRMETVILLDILTVFTILVFIIYFVAKDLQGRYIEEGRNIQTILALSQSVEAKDPYTQGHSERVAYLGKMIAEAIPALNPDTVHGCGLIHDVGKLSIPDRILLKESKLTEEEYRVMKGHAEMGAKLCKNLNVAEDIVLGVMHHHERWDGRGYPHGLEGERIPLIGRVLCVADAIDAMCSNRAYRNALEMSFVLEEVKRCEGRQFDPAIVRVVLERWTEIEAYYRSSLRDVREPVHNM